MEYRVRSLAVDVKSRKFVAISKKGFLLPGLRPIIVTWMASVLSRESIIMFMNPPQPRERQSGVTYSKRWMTWIMEQLAALGSDGTVYFSVKKAGVEYRRKTASGSVNTNAWCDLWFTFNYSTNTPAIYVNNVKYTTASTEGLLWNNTHSHMIIGNYNLGPSIGQYRGRMDEFRLYRNTIVSDAQVDNLNTNGLTITDINVDETQGVAIVNRCKIDTPLATDVYEPDDVELDDVP